MVAEKFADVTITRVLSEILHFVSSQKNEKKESMDYIFPCNALGINL